ncbi:MAG: hypothetical protein KAI28_05785 [Sphingomonadales bacterium]|nr:hypothetical protein [Sphingomonadales bacterium]
MVDDSIIRGTTTPKIVKLLTKAGAKEVHMRIASPPTSYPCFYGVDTPDRDKLLAGRMNLQQMTDYIQADSLSFLSMDGLYRAVSHRDRNNECPQFCDACFSGEYPIALKDRDSDEKRNQLNLGASQKG